MEEFREQNWRNLTVLRCSVPDCREQWASRDDGSSCPFCRVGTGQDAGFTCGDVADAAEKHGFLEDLPVHIPEPVPDLVPLTTLSERHWVGIPVFHPMSQDGAEADWRLYDIGVVVEVFDDPDVADAPRRCRFLVSCMGPGATLQYSAQNLWVPAVLARHLETT